MHFLAVSPWWNLYAHFPEVPHEAGKKDQAMEPLFESVVHYYLALRRSTTQQLVDALHWPESEGKKILAALDQPEQLDKCIALCQLLRIPPRLRDVALARAGYCSPTDLPELDEDQAGTLSRSWEHLPLEKETQLRRYFQTHGSSYEANPDVLSYDTLQPFELGLETLRSVLSTDWRTYEQRQQDRSELAAPIDIRLALRLLDEWISHLERELRYALWERRDQLLYLAYHFYESINEAWSQKATLESRVDSPLALHYKTKAVQAASALGNVALLSKVLLDRAHLYHRQRRYPQALKDVQEAVRCMGIERRTLHCIRPEFINGDIQVIWTLAELSDGMLKDRLRQLYEQAFAARKDPRQEVLGHYEDLSPDDLQQEDGFDFEGWEKPREHQTVPISVGAGAFPLNAGSEERLQCLVGAYAPESNTPSDAYDAIRHVLGREQEIIAIELLVAGLCHPDHKVRGKAARMLGELEAVEAREVLIDALRDPSGSVRGSAATALGALRNRQAVDPLIAQLVGHETKERLKEALAWDMESEHEWLPPQECRFQAESDAVCCVVQALGQIGDPRAVDSLITVLLDEELREYPRAYDYERENHRDPRLACWRDHAESLRIQVVFALEVLGDPRAVPALGEVLDEACSNVAEHALESLGGLHNIQAVPFLLKATEHASRREFETISASLEIILDQQQDEERERGIDMVLQALCAPNWCTRVIAAQTLGSLREQKAVPLLFSLLHDKLIDVRYRAVAALGTIGDREAVEPLIARLAAQDGEERRQVAEALGSLGDRRALDALIPLLSDEDREVRRATVRALGELGDPSVVGVLNDMLKLAENKELESEIYRELCLLHDPTVCARLCAMLKTTSTARLSWMIQALGELGDVSAVNPLVTLAQRATQQHCFAQIPCALQHIGGAAAVSALLRLLKKIEDSRVRFHPLEDQTRAIVDCIHALEALGDPQAIDPLLSLTTEKYNGLFRREIRQAAVKALAQFNDPRLLEPFIAVLEEEVRFRSHHQRMLIDWATVGAVIASLGGFGDPKALRALQLVGPFLGRGRYDLSCASRRAFVIYAIEQRTLAAFAQILRRPVPAEEIQQGIQFNGKPGA